MSLVPVEPPPPQWQSWGSRLSSLSPTKKLGILAVVCLILTLGVVGFRLSQPEMKPLASGLSEEQSSQVVHKLEEMKINYQLSDTGVILVPSNELRKIRLDLAGSGLPESSELGFSLFDRVNLQMTEFTERVNYLRALQGELQETIRALPGVQKVRVHLNLPEDSLLVREDQHPSASVLLQMKPGMRLSRTQCRGILRLVASSVEGMKADDITLTDTNGTLLFSGEEDLVHDPNREEDDLSRTLQRAGQTVLDNVVGVGRGVVNVRVEFQKDVRKVERTVFEADKDGKGFEKSRKQTEEDYQGTLKTPAAGQPGVTPSNTTTPVNATAAGAVREVGPNGPGERPKYRQSTQQVEFDYGKRVESVEEPANRIRRITASVVVDAKTKIDKAGVESLKQAVSLAVGIDPGRGDACTVQTLSFQREAEAPAPIPVNPAGSVPPWAYALLAPGALATLWLALGMRRRKQLAAAQAKAALDGATQTAIEGEGEAAALEAGLGTKVDISLPAEDEVPALVGAPPHNELLERARLIAREQPELVARLIVNWVNNERNKR